MRSELITTLSAVGCLALVGACAGNQKELADARQAKATCDQELTEARGKIAQLEGALQGGQDSLDLATRRMNAYREIADKLRATFDSGELTIKIRNGRMVVQLPNEILFEFGKTKLKPQGRQTLRKLAGVLKTVPGRTFLIAGHTDNVSVKNKNPKYETNWELSTLRGLAALRFLEKEGVNSKQLVAAGYGEHLPEANNKDAGGRVKNRRTEIIIMPIVSEIPRMPDAL